MKALICFRRLLVALLVLFVSGSVNRVCAQDVYELVTDVNSLAGGDNVIIVAAEYDKAMGPANTNNRQAVGITKVDNYISIAKEDLTDDDLSDDVSVTVLTLEKSDGYWAFKDGDVYLCAASSSANCLQTASSLVTAAKASVTVDEKGVATVTFQGTSQYNLLRYYASDGFSCYTSGKKDISIYKKNVNAVIRPLISSESGTYYGPQTVGLSVMGGGRIYYTLDGSEPNGASQLYTDSLSITEPCMLKAKTIRNGTESDVTTASYVISNKIDASNVKLLTDEFNGATLGLTGSAKDFNYTGAVSLCQYAGHAALNGASAIQMTESKKAGIVTTTSCGRVMGTTVTWTLNLTKGRELEFYGSHTPYTSAADLYDDNTKGDLLGTITVDTEETRTKTIDLDQGYEYLGIRPKSDTFYAANVSITWAKTETVEIGSTGYATVYYQNEALKVPNGMTAYGFTYNEGTLQAVKMSDGIVPAGTGAVLYAPVTGAYMFECTDLTGTGVVGNCLSGTDEAQTVSAESGRKLYILGNGSKGLGFYLASEDGQSANNKAHKAYLSIPAGESKVRSFLSLDDDATPVLDIQGRHQPETVYSLSGVRMNATARPGVYIVNGKKMVKL